MYAHLRKFKHCFFNPKASRGLTKWLSQPCALVELIDTVVMLNSHQGGGMLLAETPLSRICLSLGRIKFFSDGISGAGEANKFHQCRETVSHPSSPAL